MERDHPARLDRNRFAGARVASGAGGFGPNLEVAKPGYLDIVAFHQTVGDEVKERIHHVFGLVGKGER